MKMTIPRWAVEIAEADDGDTRTFVRVTAGCVETWVVVAGGIVVMI
jgi:hypothetical protein